MLSKKIGATISGVINAVIKLATGPLKIIVKLIKGDFKGALEVAKDSFNVVTNVIDGFNKSMNRVVEETKEAEDEIVTFTGKLNKATDSLIETRRALEQIRLEEEKQRISRLSYEELTAEIKEQEDAIKSLIAIIKDKNRSDEEREAAAIALGVAQGQLNLLKDQELVLNREIAEQREKDLQIQERISNATDEYNDKLEKGNTLLKTYNDELEFNNLSKDKQLEKLIEEDQLLIEQSRNRIEEIDAELEATEVSAEREAELAEEKLQIINELYAADLRYTKNTKALAAERQAADQKERDDKLKLQQERLKATSEYLDAASSQLSENTVAQKALMVASAVVSTWAGAAQVLANPLELKPYAKWAQFATTIATGMTSVKSIFDTKVPGSSNSGGGSSSASTPSLPTMPEVDTSFFETHNNLDAYDEDVFNKTQTVLVVEDMNQVQNRVQVAELSATF